MKSTPGSAVPGRIRPVSRPGKDDAVGDGGDAGGGVDA
jgi:hypothetical protein